MTVAQDTETSNEPLVRPTLSINPLLRRPETRREPLAEFLVNITEARREGRRGIFFKFERGGQTLTFRISERQAYRFNPCRKALVEAGRRAG